MKLYDTPFPRLSAHVAFYVPMGLGVEPEVGTKTSEFTGNQELRCCIRLPFSSNAQPRPENVITIAVALHLNDDDCNEYRISRVHRNSEIHSNVCEVSNMDHVSSVLAQEVG